MYGFLALIWNPASPAQTARAARLITEIGRSPRPWDPVLQAPGAAVFQVNARPGHMQAYLLPRRGASAGVVLGRLFRRDDRDGRSVPISAPLPPAEGDAIGESGGHHLIRHYWGRYVALFQDDSTGTPGSWSVLRAPLGSLPCYHTTTDGGIDVYYSRIEYCEDLLSFPPTLDWDNVARYVAQPHLQSSRTLLTGNEELLAGQRRQRTGNTHATEFLWHPADFTPDTAMTVDSAAARLRDTTIDCVQAWATGYDRVLHRLSGGLDSSIILAALRHGRTSPAITCLNYYTAGLDGDERRYARLMAQASGVPLLECGLTDAETDFPSLLRVPRNIRPLNTVTEQARGAFELSLIRDQDLEACFYGSGGDNVFFQPHTTLGALDYAHDHGFDRGLFGHAAEAARLGRASFWSVLASIAGRRLFGRRVDPLDNYAIMESKTSIVSADVRRLVPAAELIHPWLRDAAPQLAPGKLLHLQIMTMPPSYYEALNNPDLFLEPLHPLFSQPLVELCASIPTYVLTTGGRSRGLARRAFADLLPTKIVNREAKGSAHTYFNTIYTRNRDFIRSFMLDGLLCQRGLLERARLESALADKDADASAELPQILIHLNTEAWARSWNAATP